LYIKYNIFEFFPPLIHKIITQDLEVIMAKLRIFISFTAILILTLLFVNCTEDSPTTPSIDYIAPYVEWVNPSNSAELSGTVEFSFSVYDENGIDSVKLYVNGALFECEIPPCPPFKKGGKMDANAVVSPFSKDETVITISPFCKGGIKGGFYLVNSSDTTITISWNTLDYEDGVYILEARAWDTSGNLGTSPSLMVNVKNEIDPPPDDRLAPYVHWTAPEGGSTLKNMGVLKVVFFDENGVDSVNLLKNGAVVLAYKTLIDSLVYLWDTRADSDDVYIWEARAWDEAGNMGVSPALLLRVKNNEEPPPEDRTPPVVSWVSPEPGTEVDGDVNLQFDALDNIGIDNIKVYINGAMPSGFTLSGQDDESRYTVSWHTDDYADGVYDIEVRAFDVAGNVGSAPAVSFTVLNNRHRVIWVPDDYEKIQDAINASEDGDTVRVRAGIYYEGIYFWDKEIWLESESGAECTIIDATGWSFGIRVDWGQDTLTVIRGFMIENAESDGIIILQGSSPNIYNNIITASGRNSIHIIDVSRSIMRNNIFELSTGTNTSIYTCYGIFENNLVIHSPIEAMWNRSNDDNPLKIDYNLFWDYGELRNEPNPFLFGPNNIYDKDPMFIENTYIPNQNSPCINSGNPQILDFDGSRSDIGAYGGPYAYPPQ
jgi:hypothetical protein